jgi:hypothetical protein
MSGPVGSSTWFGTSGYNLNQSLRFEDGSSPYLSFTPGSAGNRRTWTFSTWIKRGNLGVDIDLLHAYESGERSQLVFASDDTIKFDFDDYTANRLTTTQKFRDVSAWYHIVLAVDTTQATAANRVKIYVNGNQITDFSAASYPSENEEGHINEAIQHEISSYDGSGSYHDGYLAEVNFIDGAQKVPADFGETGAFGEWVPIEYAGAYGTNGFYLNFAGGGLISATGGTITTDGDFKVHTFTSNGTFTPTITGHTESDVEYLVIAGGGGGGAKGGGGGAGGYRTGFEGITSGTGYGITVGAGGAGGTGLSVRGVNGANSVFDSVTSVGGGGGGSDAGVYRNGSDGGSGGGVAGGGYTDTVAGGSATSGQGFDGGNHITSSPYNGGGGGGAGAVGATNGNGGAGLASSITGSSVTRAGGGGGGGDVSGSAGAAGAGGGGAGAGASDTPAAGTVNTGGGGGAGGNGGGHVDGAAGGSGIVIIRYRFQ